MKGINKIFHNALNGLGVYFIFLIPLAYAGAIQLLILLHMFVAFFFVIGLIEKIQDGRR